MTSFENNSYKINLVHKKLEQTPLLSQKLRSDQYGTLDSNNSSDKAVSDQHCHALETPNSGIDKRARRKLFVASVICLLFMTGEIVGGVLANSLAIATDAAHLLTDLASFMISIFSLYLASRPATKRMSFGWYRAEVMGAMISVLLIWVVTGILLYMAVQRVINQTYDINAKVMLITAGVGVAVNIIMGITLHDAGHGHSHGGLGGAHTHSHTDLVSASSDPEATTRLKPKRNINVRAAFIHVIGDLLQSVGVLIAAFIIFFKPEWKLADPICTFLFSILICITTIAIMRDVLHVLMEGTPKGIQYTAVKSALCSVKGVREVHNIRIWSLTMSKAAMSAHLAIDEEADSEIVLSITCKILRDRFDIHESTIQVEKFVDQMNKCAQCKDPCD